MNGTIMDNIIKFGTFIYNRIETFKRMSLNLWGQHRIIQRQSYLNSEFPWLRVSKKSTSKIVKTSMTREIRLEEALFSASKWFYPLIRKSNKRNKQRDQWLN